MGCTTLGDLEERLASWKQRPITAVFEVWGPPSGASRLADGNTEYRFERVTTRETRLELGQRGRGTFSGGYQPSSREMHFCTAKFVVDQDSQVIAWSYAGENCIELLRYGAAAPR